MKTLLKKITTKAKNNPKGLYVLFYTETCELFGRFGLTSLLVLYLTKQVHYSDVHAFAIFSSFIALIFITPIIGGILSDRVFGSYFSVIVGSILMGAGNIVLGLNQATTVYLWPCFCVNR
jgi:proton-dependent oligopeptide transporter, POT family